MRESILSTYNKNVIAVSRKDNQDEMRHLTLLVVEIELVSQALNDVLKH